MPSADMKKMQDEANFTELMVVSEGMKTYPFGDVWDEFCARNNVPQKQEWFKDVKDYEKNVLSARA